MNYGYKVTTGGRELLAALLATGEELEITRVAIGSGKVSEDTNLADMTGLIQYVAEGRVAQRRHENNVLLLMVQYASNFTPGLGAFYLSEFTVEARHPISGESITLLYATLGDYIQPVVAYSETGAPDVRNYPIALVISDELNVTISVPAGLVTYDDLQEAVDKALASLIISTIVLPDFAIAADGWAVDETETAVEDYPLCLDVPCEYALDVHVPTFALDKACLAPAINAGLCPTADVLGGSVRFWAAKVPDTELVGTLTLLAPTGGGSEGRDPYVLPVASGTTLGGVKIKEGTGLTIDEDGCLGIDTATDEELSDTLDEVYRETPDTGDQEIATDAEVSDMIDDVFG